MAKACQADLNSEAIANCQPIQPFTFANQIGSADAETATRCEQLMREGANQVNPALADPGKTEAFKDALRQKAAILAAP